MEFKLTSMSKPPNLKVCMLLPHIGSGGDWTAVATMAKGLTARGHEFLVAAASVDSVRNPEFEGRIEATINRGSLKLIRSAFARKEEFPEDIDILHSHSPSSLMYAILIKWLRCRKARIMMTFHWEIPESRLGLAAKRFLFRFADRLHVMSRETEDYFKTTYKVPGEKTRLVFLGTDPELFPLVSSKERQKFREQFALPDEAIVIGFAGRLNPEKNIPVILEFMNRYAEQYPQLHLLVMGEGPMKQEYEALASAGAAAGRIHFTGLLRPIRNGYGALDLLLLPSTSMETFGLVCVEAGMCGIPTFRSSIAGAIDQIEEGVNGWVYPKEDDSAFQAKLCELLSRPEKFRPAGLAARERFLTKFGMENVVIDLEEVYLEMTAG